MGAGGKRREMERMAKYIDAEDAAKIVEAQMVDGKMFGTDDLTLVDAYAIIDGIGDLPAADVEPVRHGLWVGEGDGYAETDNGEMALVYDVWECNKCGYTIDDGTDDPDLLPKYCPGCGAKMDEEVWT